MHAQIGSNERHHLRSTNRFLRLVVLFLCVVVVVLTGVLGWAASRDNVKIVPPLVSRPYEIGSNYASREYLVDMGNYLVLTMNKVTPGNVGKANETILKMVEPSSYGTVKAQLDTAAERIKRSNISTDWDPVGESIDFDRKRVYMKGIRRVYMADALVSSDKREYRLTFSITDSGRLYVRELVEIQRDKTGTEISSDTSAGGAS